MELKLDIGFEQLLVFIRQLPANQIAKLKIELPEILVDSQTQSIKNTFRKLLLDSPTMSENQQESYLQTRERFKQWKAR